MRFYYILFYQFIFSIPQGSLIAQNSNYDRSVETLYNEGIEYLIKSNYSAARNRFEEYVKIAPNTSVNSINAEYYKAFAALNLYHNDGEYLISTFIAKHPNHPKSLEANYELGKFYYAENNTTKAIKYLSEAEANYVGSNEKTTEIKFKLGYSLFSKRKFDEALMRFDAVKYIRGEYFAAANYYAGYVEFEQQKFDKALTDLKNAGKSEAYRHIVPYMISAIYYNKKDFALLLKYAEPLLQKDEMLANSNDILLLVADANYHLEQFDKASSYYSQYLKQVNSNQIDVPLQYRIGYVAYINKDYDLAIDFFKKVASVDEGDLGFYASYYLGVLYVQSNNKMFAITAFDKARKLESDRNVMEESLFQFAKLSYDLNRSDEAIKGFKEYITMFNGGVYIDVVDELLSEVYFHTNNYDEALDYIKTINKRSTRVNEVYQKASFYKGVSEFNKSNYAQASNYFKQATTVSSDDNFTIKAHYWLAETYAIGNRYEEALTHYQKVIWNATDENRTEKNKARYGLGYLYYNTKDYKSALESFNIYINTNNPELNKRMYNDALIRLADCYYVIKQYSIAIEKYKESIALSKTDNDYAELNLGIIYGIDGQYDNAIKFFNSVIDNYPNSKYNDDAIYYKAQLLFENGEFEKAINNFSLLISKRRGRFTPNAYLKRATAYYNVRQYDNSIKDYKKLISEFSSHKVAQQSLIPLQEVLSIQNRSSEFERYLSMFKQANPNNTSTERIEYEAAKTLYFNQNYELAKDKLLSFTEDYPESALLLEAHFYLGEANNQLGDTEEALKHYSMILENKNYTQYNRVVGRMAKIEQQQQRYDNAMYYYTTLLSSANNKKEQNNSLIGMMECSYYLTAFDSCRQYAERLLALGTANASDQNKASLYLGKSAMATGEFQTAKDDFLQTVNTAKDVYGAEAQYLIGEIYYLEKSYDKSIEALVELNNSFYSYEYWLGKGFLLIVDNYIATEEYFQAKGTLSSIIEGFPLEEIVEIAKTKLLDIEKLEQKEFTVELDSSRLENDTTNVENR